MTNEQSLCHLVSQAARLEGDFALDGHRIVVPNSKFLIHTPSNESIVIEKLGTNQHRLCFRKRL